ncbi:hypothetical protein J1N09_06400 [Aureitalea sp. L0-47]|uniref:hypothetical protein n=1 Tax=Aureitalea sp. L0-47 TaxID=2816962 RepID=UPI00223736D1|nr:hypothetical protein [Aureitalea sp. L0-47]MCW5519460.1 hypothetical protein [Aureitalea sp. L0-47]
MKRLLLLLFIILLNSSLSAQVGINTTTPDYTLEVNGTTMIDNGLYLEKPGVSNQIRGSKLLIALQSNEIVQYDIDQSKYGPINYAEFIFRDLSKDGLQDYDTKISIDDYIVTVQGFYYLEAGSGDTDVMTNSNNGNDNIEGHQIYAYKNTTTNTWFLRAFVNDSEFRTRFGTTFGSTPVDMFLNLIIYRKGFISKEINSISVDLSGNETGIAPLPAGF